jgi:hypothetical protein
MGGAAGAAAGAMAVGCWELAACLLLLRSEEETGMRGQDRLGSRAGRMKYWLYGATGYMQLYASIGSQKVVQFARGYGRGVQKMLGKMPSRVMNSAGKCNIQKTPVVGAATGCFVDNFKKVEAHRDVTPEEKH